MALAPHAGDRSQDPQAPDSKVWLLLLRNERLVIPSDSAKIPPHGIPNLP